MFVPVNGMECNRICIVRHLGWLLRQPTAGCLRVLKAAYNRGSRSQNASSISFFTVRKWPVAGRRHPTPIDRSRFKPAAQSPTSSWPIPLAASKFQSPINPNPGAAHEESPNRNRNHHHRSTRRTRRHLDRPIPPIDHRRRPSPIRSPVKATRGRANPVGDQAGPPRLHHFRAIPGGDQESNLRAGESSSRQPSTATTSMSSTSTGQPWASSRTPPSS
jgi:hypothetical protein